MNELAGGEKKGLSTEDWEILYDHGGKEIKELQEIFTDIFKKRSDNTGGPLEGTIGELIATVPESSRDRIYRLFGKAILNCRKKGYLTDIKLK